ncbi:hypothetical protein SAMN05421813_12020 [Daejeonella rubra]|uniref:Uncharacterized protein n=2 Tax=Daejeonella rubra TaxID=990371 RepID=A0A1G9VCC5_9SPHI|nr:hypothetical protein SAMN05421813_12020 [Daejeonella rubra]
MNKYFGDFAAKLRTEPLKTPLNVDGTGEMSKFYEIFNELKDCNFDSFEIERKTSEIPMIDVEVNDLNFLAGKIGAANSG